MLDANLSPVTLDKLAAFARRRRGLIALRGLCSLVVSLLGVMTLIAVIDYFVVMPREMRWAMSITGYVVVAIVVWFTCLRGLFMIPRREELARLIEATQPELH
jgi:hypothetical protein